MLGILSFLVQWLALSHIGSRNYLSSHQFSSPPKSHWALLSEFHNLPEDEIEAFLPQICNILLDRDQKDDFGLYEHFERILIDKCAGCLTFGMRVCGLLKVQHQAQIMHSCMKLNELGFCGNSIKQLNSEALIEFHSYCINLL